MEKLLIIDGNSLVNRAFYALPLLSNDKGEYSNAVYGFTNILVKFIIEEKPDYICVAFDHSRHTFRTDMYKDYKGTRKQMPDELRTQMPILKDLLVKMNIKIFEIDKIEADDIIGTVSKNSQVQNIILSGDRDVLQLIDDKTQVWLTKKGISEVVKVDNQNMKDIFGFSPNQVVDMKSLMGDSSDNIPGVSGIGEKTALNLITEYKTLDGVYSNLDNINGKLNEKLVAGKDMAYLSYKLATIKTDCDINFKLNEFCFDFPFNDDVKKVFEKYQFKTLLKRSELFKNDSIQNFEEKKSKKVEEIAIKDLNHLNRILKEQKIEFLAFDFVNKIEFSFNQDFVFYLPTQTNLFDMSVLTKEDIINSLLSIFSDEKIEKITYDLKSHLYNTNIYKNLKGEIFDVSIAMYLVHAGERVGKEINVKDYYCQKQSLVQEMESFGLNFVYKNIEMPLTYVLFEMEQDGFKVDKEELYLLAEKYQQELFYLEQKIYSVCGTTFNIKSPKQVAGVLYDTLHLSDKGNKKHSTGIDVLNSLIDQHEVVPLLIRYRKIQKLFSAYIEPYTKMINENGDCIHTVFNQTLTATGRLSSSEPNLQNIPVREEEGKNLRKIFVSRFKNGQIVSADYNQIELRLLASFSNDENLIKAYESGKDIHKSTASQIFDKPLNEITSHERTMAKAVNFGIVYGISAYGLANQINVHPSQAKIFMDRYLATYKNVTKYMQDNINFAKQNGYIKTMYGRIRKINELYSSNKNLVMFGERVAMNMPLQGSASDIIKLAMIKVNNQLKKQNLESKLILQIHDELIVDAKQEEVDEVKNILKSCMENVANLTVPLTVNITNGKTWFDAQK